MWIVRDRNWEMEESFPGREAEEREDSWTTLADGAGTLRWFLTHWTHSVAVILSSLSLMQEYCSGSTQSCVDLEMVRNTCVSSLNHSNILHVIAGKGATTGKPSLGAASDLPLTGQVILSDPHFTGTCSLTPSPEWIRWKQRHELAERPSGPACCSGRSGRRVHHHKRSTHDQRVGGLLGLYYLTHWPRIDSSVPSRPPPHVDKDIIASVTHRFDGRLLAHFIQVHKWNYTLPHCNNVNCSITKLTAPKGKLQKVHLLLKDKAPDAAILQDVDISLADREELVRNGNIGDVLRGSAEHEHLQGDEDDMHNSKVCYKESDIVHIELRLCM